MEISCCHYQTAHVWSAFLQMCSVVEQQTAHLEIYFLLKHLAVCRPSQHHVCIAPHFTVSSLFVAMKYRLLQLWGVCAMPLDFSAFLSSASSFHPAAAALSFQRSVLLAICSPNFSCRSLIVSPSSLHEVHLH